MELIKLRVYNVGNKGSININPKLIETVIVSPYNDKYILILALSQGARYQLATSEGKYLFDTKEEAEAELNTILAECSQDIFITVSELPPTGESNKIYLVPSTDPESQNTLDEYIWIDNDWELIGNISVDLDAYNIRFNGSGTNYLVGETEVEGAVKELDTRVKTNADNVALKVDTSDIVDDLVSTDVDKPLSANQGKVLNDKKVDKTQTIIGLDLQDNILIGEFRTALGNATQSVAGLLSAEDKTHLDGLVALLETSDSNNVVDTIGEILAIFQNYPEGADLVTVLQGKVDKVAGKGLSTNDFTDEYKNKLDGIEVGAEVNPYSKTQLDNMFDDKVDKVSGMGLSDENFTLLEKNKLANLTQVVPDEETIVFNANDELEATNVSIWRYE